MAAKKKTSKAKAAGGTRVGIAGLAAILQKGECKGMSLAAIRRALRAAGGAIATEIKHGHTVAIRGLGTFKKVHKKARKGYNVKTKRATTFPAGKRVKFTASVALKG